MIAEMGKSMPEDRRKVFQDILNNYVDLKALEAHSKASMARHLTAEEIEAYVAFMKNPHGKSSMEKMKFYMADVMPFVQGEVRRAVSAYQEEEQVNSES